MVKDKRRTDFMDDYDWYINTDLSQYKGLWVGIYRKKVVKTSTKVEEIMQFAKENYPKKTVRIAKIP